MDVGYRSTGDENIYTEFRSFSELIQTKYMYSHLNRVSSNEYYLHFARNLQYFKVTVVGECVLCSSMSKLCIQFIGMQTKLKYIQFVVFQSSTMTVHILLPYCKRKVAICQNIITESLLSFFFFSWWFIVS